MSKAEEKQTSDVGLPIARLRDKRVPPEGVVPKQAQGYVIAGLAVLILLAVMFSKNHTKPTPNEPVAPPVTVPTDSNQRRIQELEQDLSADQRESQQRAQAQSTRTSLIGSASPTPTPTISPVGASQLSQSQEPLRDPIADAEKALAFKARFTSNLVSADDGASRVSPADSDEAMSRPNGNSDTTKAFTSDLLRHAPDPQVPTTSKRATEVNVNSAHGQPFLIFEGTTIDTALLNRLNGEFAGPVKVMVTNPVYSQDRQHVLIPEGTFVLGDTEKVSGFGQKRLAVTFHRLIMPDGYSVDLDQFHGLDQVGDTGLQDKTNNHYLQIFGTSIALGVIAGAAESTNANAGYDESGSEAYKAGIASSLSQSSANVLDRFINVLPSITIREGHRIKVYLTQDILLPAYENHTVPSDL
jgi:type IV secretory pathway VirB10-like protein